MNVEIESLKYFSIVGRSNILTARKSNTSGWRFKVEIEIEIERKLKVDICFDSWKVEYLYSS